MIFKTDASRGDLNGFLDHGSLIQGELHFETTFRVDGQVEGKIISEGDLVVGDGGQVQGEVHVGQVFVSGVVRGVIRAGHRVHIAPAGRVFADLDTPSLIIEDGAIFEGRCVMSRHAGAPGHGAEAAGPKLVAAMPVSKAEPGGKKS